MKNSIVALGNKGVLTDKTIDAHVVRVSMFVIQIKLERALRAPALTSCCGMCFS